MDKAHAKRLIILAATTLVVVGLAVFGLVTMNEQMQTALVNAHNNVMSSETANPATNDSLTDVNIDAKPER